MARNEVSRLKITIDIDQATGKILRFNQTLGDTQRKVQQTGQSMSQMQAQTQAAGNTAAASAVNFQTMSQGLLNLSTSAVQTFTSISNLDRAQNRAKQSVIAVARAQDLLANKEQRAAEMRERGIASGQKYENILREIETATADLTVKQEKQKIEQDAVNDIYMLFYANIANVGFSTMQTVVAMLGQEKAARLGAVVATKLHTLATWDNVRAARLSATNAKAVAVFWGGAASSGLSLATIKTKLLTAAMTGLKFALGPIGIAMIAITAAWMAYDHAVGGVTAEVKEFDKTLDNARAGVDDMTDSMAELTGETKKGTRFDALPHMIAMQKEFEKQLHSTTKEIDNQTKSLEKHGKSFPTRTGFSTPSTENVGGETKTTAEANIPEWLAAHAQPDPMIVGGGRDPYKSGLIDSELLTHGITAPGYRPANPFAFPNSIELDDKGNRITPEQMRTQLNIGDMKVHFEESKKKVENKIIELQNKGENITSEERKELHLLSMEYSQYYKDREINVYTGRSQIVSGISQDQMLEDWGKKQIFKYSGTGNLREAAGYEVDRDFKDSLFAKVLRGEQLTIDEYFEFQSTIGKKSDYYRRVGEELFPYGTNTGGALGIRDLMFPSSTKQYGYASGLQDTVNAIRLGLRTPKQQVDQYDRRLYESQFFGMKQPLSSIGSFGQEDLSRYAERQIEEGRIALSETTTLVTDSSGNQTLEFSQASGDSFNRRNAIAMGRATWYKEQNRNYTVSRGGSGHGIVNHYVRNAVNDEDRQAMTNLANSHDQQVREYGEEAFERGKDLDILWLRKQTENQAKALSASISMRVTAERATALEFGNQLGISQNEALAILRDKSQGEQTLNDMLAYQQRLDAMSNGVVS